MLNKPITNEEIKSIFFNTPNDKAPGPDGYTSAFFKDRWDIIGEDICALIKEFFTSCKLLSQMNATNITLIPKHERHTSFKHFRPIACCNMIYKVISKLLCNRLSLVLPDIVSENQGAFIKGRSIIENVLICQDIVQLYKRKAVSPRCLFKIDLQKAYDTVEWEFLEQLLHGLGFPEAFSHRVMTCVTSTRFSLCLNGNAHAMMLLIRAFSSFPRASRLTMNNAKSEVYYNGVSSELKNDIHQATGFVEGSLPFRYLGVPIQAGMFINPKGVIRRIEGICRNYLWDGSADYHRVPLVAWDKVTLPKDEGCLGIKKEELCNIAAVAKLVDWEPETQEHLFFDCLYSRQVLRLIEQWCGFKIAVDSNASSGRSAGIREDAMKRIRSKFGRTAVNEERTWLQKSGIVV
ncbi:uncharacterized protein LOC141637230 [Silene latifolia]|uniref:uncharacterized protein LOC141637230 n=1 Tax=Silene latifolia TaxID=37657 RepID=UPI003D77FB1A